VIRLVSVLLSLGLAEMQAELDTIEQQKEDLNRREHKAHRCLELHEEGLSAKEIAKSLGVSRNKAFRYFRKAKAGV
jgi:DNA-binding CsgD family transcriptional regulator